MQLESENPSLWYKNAIIYQVHIKSFCDSNRDGIGDFQGLISKLDYIQSLGVNAIWLLPFYPSPLKDDGYDIADYYNVHPIYGTLKDFKTLIKEAHDRGLKIITEMVINHTSDQHPWFQKSRTSKPGSKWYNYYVWSDTPAKYEGARIIFQDFETSNWTWDSLANAFYWHRFYSHQPDLNFECEDVKAEVLKAIDFWMDMGVDGMRLDAIPYLYEKEGTNCENLPATHEFIKEIRRHVDSKYENRMLLAEANQWPEDAIAYFGNGDECHMAFHFPLMPRLYMSIGMEDNFPMMDILEQTPPIPDNCQWVFFLRNHDELTLEMVSEEERDFMLTHYAKESSSRINLGIRRRLAPLLGNNMEKIKAMNFLLVSLPGAPVIYYGDEIGMGDNHFLGDRNGVRTPMQWHSGKNAGFSKANPQQLYLPLIIDPEYHYEVVNVENQEATRSSLLWWMRNLLHNRQRYSVFGTGKVEFLEHSNSKILVFLRSDAYTVILVVINLSQYPEATELNLEQYKGSVPLELMRNNPFPPIERDRYSLTLGPYGHYWLQIYQKDTIHQKQKHVEKTVVLNTWNNFSERENISLLEESILPFYLPSRRWYRSKTQDIASVKVQNIIPLEQSFILIIVVSHLENHEQNTYILPVSFGETHSDLQPKIANAIVNGQSGILYDATYDPLFRQALVQFIITDSTTTEKTGSLIAKIVADVSLEAIQSSDLIRGEQSNTSIKYGSKYFLKLFRKLESGINPDVAISEFLRNHNFTATPAFIGEIALIDTSREFLTSPASVALLQQFVPNQGSAWDYTMKVLENSQGHTDEHFLSAVTKMALRTAELHLALASDSMDPAFSPDRIDYLYLRSLYQALRAGVRKTLKLLKNKLDTIPAHYRPQADTIILNENRILKFMSQIIQTSLPAKRIRIHGDFHLGQILCVGDDFYISDFEGEPLHSLFYRNLKRSPLQDVAGILRSYHYAGYAYLLKLNKMDSVNTIEEWFNEVKNTYLEKYFSKIDNDHPGLIPSDQESKELWLNILMLEKNIYEIRYDLNNRPDWVIIPIQTLTQFLQNTLKLF